VENPLATATIRSTMPKIFHAETKSSFLSGPRA
jgi:hypothetical protein